MTNRLKLDPISSDGEREGLSQVNSAPPTHVDDSAGGEKNQKNSLEKNGSSSALIMQVNPFFPDPFILNKAAALLREGQLVAFPTETVYGLGADALRSQACMEVFRAKQRPPNHPLIVHVDSIEMAKDLCDNWSTLAEKLAKSFWPGPLSLVLKKASRVPMEVTGGGDTVALRMPRSEVALRLLSAFGGPIAAPSANLYQGVSPTEAWHVARSLGSRVQMILDGGPCSLGIESCVVDVSRLEVLRLGPISKDALLAVAPQLSFPSFSGKIHAIRVEPNLPLRSPGMGDRHYSPRAPLFLFEKRDFEAAYTLALTSNRRFGVLHYSDLPADLGHHFATKIKLILRPSLYEYELYRCLNYFDTLDLQEIIVECPPSHPEFWAVIDRLYRASQRH